MKSGLMLGVNPKAERQKNDYYATNPNALTLFLDKLREDNIELNHEIWEPACGEGHLSKILIGEGYDVFSSDLIYRGYGKGDIDFINNNHIKCNGDILTNPPFKLAEKFVETGMNKIGRKQKLLLFLKIQFLEGQKRKKLFQKYKPNYVYCYSARQLCAKNGEFKKYNSTTQFYCWIIWNKGFDGDTIIKWI